MARTDAVVLGAGIVGTSIALHLAKRGLAVALVDRRGPGEETSYGNAGIIEGNTLFPHPFPRGLAAFLSTAAKRESGVNYHLSFLPRIVPWLLGYRSHTSIEQSIAFANAMRPLFASALAEHEVLIAEAGATHYLRKNGWLKLYRSERTFAAATQERAMADSFNLPYDVLDSERALSFEPALKPVFARAVLWPQAASVSNPVGLTRAYARRFAALGGVFLNGDARSLHRANGKWRIETAEGPLDANDAVVALGPWAPDVLDRLDIRLPLAVKRGYHLHFRPREHVDLTRPVVDVELGCCLAPMDQGLRLTTGAEFAARDAPPTPVQLDRVMPAMRDLVPLGEAVEAKPWLGSRPCFPDSRPVIGRAPVHRGLWLAYGHAHWGLTLGPATGRLLAEKMTGATPFCDPAPFAAERFGR